MPVRTKRPSNLTIEAIEKRQIRIETRFVKRSIRLGESEGVLSIVEIAKFHAFCMRIARRRRQNEVFDPRSPEPLNPNRPAATGNKILRQRADECLSPEALDYWTIWNFDNDR